MPLILWGLWLTGCDYKVMCALKIWSHKGGDAAVQQGYGLRAVFLIVFVWYLYILLFYYKDFKIYVLYTCYIINLILYFHFTYEISEKKIYIFANSNPKTTRKPNATNKTRKPIFAKRAKTHSSMRLCKKIKISQKVAVFCQKKVLTPPCDYASILTGGGGDKNQKKDNQNA